MLGKHNSSGQKSVPDLGAATGRPRPHPLLKTGIIIAILLVVLGLLSLYLPTYIARHLIISEFDKLGIEYEGVDTLEINPWSRELWFGPVRFGAGPSNAGQVGELGLTIQYNPLLDRRVYIESMMLRGVDVVVTRGEDKAFFLDGIPLKQFMNTPDESEKNAENGVVWGAGIDSFELRDSRLLIEERGQGDLEIEVERLALAEFRTWDKENPGRFELNARVNEIQLNWSGEARPFADNITLDIDSRTKQAEVPKVVRFTGPWGLDRRDGTYNAELKYQMTIFNDGRLEGYIVGTIDIIGADYARADTFELAIEEARLEIDVNFIWSESDELTLQGTLVTGLGKSSAATAKNRLASTAARIAMDRLDIAYAKDKILRIAMQPEIDLESAAFSGPIDLSVEKVGDLLVFLQSLSDPGAVSEKDTGLGDFTDESVVSDSLDIKLGQLQSKGDSFFLQSAGGQFELGLELNSELSEIRLAPGEGHKQDQQVEIKRLKSRLENLSMTSGQGRLTLGMAGGNSLTTLTSVGPRGNFKVDKLEIGIGKLELRLQPGVVALVLADAAKTTRGFSGVVYAQEGLPEAQFSLGVVSAALGQASLDASGGKLQWQGIGDIRVDSLAADFAKGKDSAARFDSAEIHAARLNQQGQLSANAMTIDGLDLFIKRSLLEVMLQREGAGKEQTVSRKEAMVEPASAVAESKLQKADVSRAQTLLAELGYEPGPADGLMGRRTAEAIKAFQRREGLTVDGRLTRDLLIALQARLNAPSVKNGQDSDGGISVGQLALTGKSVIRFRDDIISPPVTIDAVIKEAGIQNLDTRKTDQRTKVRIVADINEFTQMELSGWANGIGKNTDLDLNAKVDNLELSTYSPYVVKLSGVQLESGQLDTTAAGKAVQGSLEGEIQIGIEDIAFRPLDEAEAARMTDTMGGIPLETVVGLLQDSKGHIDLNLPVGGALDQPKVDISSAVQKAIGGALKKVFPPTMIASLMSGVEKGTGPAFEPIVFIPGLAELDEAAQRYADDLAEMLVEHPRLSLKVCSRLTVQDLEKLVTADKTAPTSTVSDKTRAVLSEAKPGHFTPKETQDLTQLAVERQRVVRRYLIGKKGVNADRIGECRSRLESTNQGNPRVEILLKH